MFEDGKCPMLQSNVIDLYGLSDNFIRRFCSYGCSVECGKFLKERLDKKGMKPLYEQDGSGQQSDDGKKEAV